MIKSYIWRLIKVSMKMIKNYIISIRRNMEEYISETGVCLTIISGFLFIVLAIGGVVVFIELEAGYKEMRFFIALSALMVALNYPSYLAGKKGE